MSATEPCATFTRYTVNDLTREARAAARSHATREGHGRPFAIRWTLLVHQRGASLAVHYCAIPPEGHEITVSITVAI